MTFRALLARLEIGPVSALLVAAFGLFAFARLADEVQEGETHRFDEAILLALRNPLDPADPVGPWWVEAMMRDVTALGGTVVLTFITVVAVLYLAMIAATMLNESVPQIRARAARQDEGGLAILVIACLAAT
ncbi:MAG: hypothetical protein ACOVOI_22710, partial [Hyphomicrobiales bacterium]